MQTCEMCNTELDDVEIEICKEDNTSLLCDNCWGILCNYWIPFEDDGYNFEEVP